MSKQEIARAEVKVGLIVLAPEWAFGSSYDECGDRQAEVRVIRIEERWRGNPRLVRIEAADGRRGIINVSWLRKVKP